jgi:hypothetical protein
VAGFEKANFGLGRMDVDVDELDGNVDDDPGGACELSGGRPERPVDGGGEHAVADRPTVDDEKGLSGRSALEKVSGNADLLGGMSDRGRPRGALCAEDIGKTMREVAGRRKSEEASRSLVEEKGNVRARDGEPSEGCHDVAELGIRGAEELPPRGQAEEEVVRVDASTARPGTWSRSDELAEGDLDAVAAAGRRGALDDEAGCCRDGRQGLAAKAERRDRREVADVRQLRRGVALEGEVEIVMVHPLAVVFDRQEIATAREEGDGDPPGIRIEGVLDELLDGGCRSLDDLAGSDLVDDAIGEEAYSWHGRNLTRAAGA